jgi:ArsR family transcriptional regulator
MEYEVSLFSALADPIRLRALALVAEKGELCVCELTQALRVSQPTASKHMATLREAGVLKDRRDAQWVLYSLSPALPGWAREVVEGALKGIRRTAGHRDDLDRLAAAVRPSRRRSA